MARKPLISGNIMRNLQPKNQIAKSNEQVLPMGTCASATVELRHDYIWANNAFGGGYR